MVLKGKQSGNSFDQNIVSLFWNNFASQLPLGHSEPMCVLREGYCCIDMRRRASVYKLDC